MISYLSYLLYLLLYLLLSLSFTILENTKEFYLQCFDTEGKPLRDFKMIMQNNTELNDFLISVQADGLEKISNNKEQRITIRIEDVNPTNIID